MKLAPELQSRVVLDSVPDPTLLVDQHGSIVFASSRCQTVFGYTPEELVGRPIETLLPERYRKAHASHRQHYFERLQPRAMGMGLELAGLRKDGSEFPVEVSLSPVETDLGTLVLSAVRDISERLRAEQALAETKEAVRALRENEERLRWALEGANGGAWDWDLIRGEAWWSAEMYALWGIEPGTPMKLENSLAPVLEPDRERLRVEQAIASGSDYRAEFRIRHPERGERWMASRGRLVYDENGRAVRMLGITLDVTERKRAEEALLRSHEDLEQLVEERTTEAEAARREAERGDRSKSRFLAAASHDLRQPLQSVGLYLSVLSRQIQNPKQRAVCDKMAVSLETMRDLLDALLDISKLESGSVEPEKVDFPVRQLIDRVVNSSLQQAQRKGLRLEASVTDCVVHSDPALLERVLDNFVSNAIRYTERGGIELGCERQESVARIFVRDTGIGIPSDALEDIFEEYYQLDNSMRDRSKGLGLGLAIVRHIARVLDHAVQVESSPGQGATFSVEVPLGQSAAGHQGEVAADADRSSPDARPPLVLLVEDDASIVDATTLLLESAGMQVLGASDGEAALAEVGRSGAPDVVVTDYRLPGINGAEVIRCVRRAVGRELPAILVTGDTSALDADVQGLEACAVLHKPVDTERLLELIDSLAAGAGAEASAL